MNKRWVFAGGIGVAAVALAIWVAQAPPEPTTPVDLPVPAEASESIVTAPLQDDASETLSQDVSNLEAALALAIERRVEAEQALDALEVEVDELEAFVDDIEARGEDPVDYADEGLAQFQPSFERYEAAFAALEEAEQVEQLARDALAEAKAAAQ
ncbi:MAG: hypothetical protein AAFN07_13630 [Pseudomonadota bacterium]